MEEFDNIIKRNIEPQISNILKPLIITSIASFILFHWFAIARYPFIVTIFLIACLVLLIRATNTELRYIKYTLYLSAGVCLFFPFVHIHVFNELIRISIILIGIFAFLHFTIIAKNSVRLGLIWLFSAPIIIGMFSTFVLDASDNISLAIILLSSICSWLYLATNGNINPMKYLFLGTILISILLFMISFIVIKYYSLSHFFNRIINKYSIPIKENDLESFAQLFSAIIIASFFFLGLICLSIVIFRKRKEGKF